MSRKNPPAAQARASARYQYLLHVDSFLVPVRATRFSTEPFSRRFELRSEGTRLRSFRLYLPYSSRNFIVLAARVCLRAELLRQIFDAARDIIVLIFRL
jgi:hypothetical protein